MRCTTRWSFLAGAALLAAACGPSRTERPVESTGSGNRTTSAAGTVAARRGATMVRFVNVAPSEGTLSLAADDTPILQNIAYRGVTPYTEITDNVTVLKIRHAGRDSVLSDNREMVSDGARYTVVALPDEHGKVSLRVFKDDLAPSPDKARLRVIHAVPGLDHVDVSLQGATQPIFDDLGEGHEAGFRDVDPTAAAILVRHDPESSPLLRITNLRLDAAHAYTIVLTRTPDRRIEAVTFEDQVQPQTALATPARPR
jgi:hypothetical protein